MDERDTSFEARVRGADPQALTGTTIALLRLARELGGLTTMGKWRIGLVQMASEVALLCMYEG